MNYIASDTLAEDFQPLDRRVARLEGASPHLATKADLKELETTMIKWLVGIAISIAAVIIAAVGIAMNSVMPVLEQIISRLP